MRSYWIAIGLVVAVGVGAALGMGVCADTDRPGLDTPGTVPGSETPAVPRRAAVTDPPPSQRDIARSFAEPEARAPERTDWSGGDANAGGALFQQHCALCHGADGGGDGPAAVALNPKPRDFRDGTYYLDADANGETGEDVDLARVILEGPGAFGGSDEMVGWAEVFDEHQVRDLVAYLRTLERR